MYDCDSDRQRAVEVARTLVRTWENARDLSEANGAEFVAVLQPVAFIGNASHEYLDLSSPINLALGNQYNAVYPLVRRYAQESDISFFDLTGVYDGCEDCYIDFCHVGPEAHYRLNDVLSTHLLGSREKTAND